MNKTTDKILFLSGKPAQEVDVLLITGDMYVDHPSYGVAIMARLLESMGLSVCIASQPEYFNPAYLKHFPEVRLFIGITSGNLDSIVNNYSSSRNLRKKDDYSIGGEPNFPNGKRKRPDRALIPYTAFIKQRFKNIPIILGGLEASLRRFAHFDYVQQKLRRSILLDSKADLIVYSMGERAIIEIVERLKRGESLKGIRGTSIKVKKEELSEIEALELPSFEEIERDRAKLTEATAVIEANMVPDKASNLYQEQKGGYVLSYLPQDNLSGEELDRLYTLPFRKDFPAYCEEIPAWRMIKESITSHRGCAGRCSYCAIAGHQGPVVTSRSEDSIITEVKELTKKPFFKGTVTDVGGPTANMYGMGCKIGWCKDPHCLFPTVCKNLIIDEKIYLNLLKKAKKVEGVKNLFVTSGIRYDLALLKEEETEWIIRHATSGHFKIAPEHIDPKVLKLMKKPSQEEFIRFINFFNRVKRRHSLKYFLLPYLILSHPGSTVEAAKKLAAFLKKEDIKTFQYQDFTPTPQTISTALFYSGKDAAGRDIPVTTVSSRNNTRREILKKALSSPNNRGKSGGRDRDQGKKGRRKH